MFPPSKIALNFTHIIMLIYLCTASKTGERYRGSDHLQEDLTKATSTK